MFADAAFRFRDCRHTCRLRPDILQARHTPMPRPPLRRYLIRRH